MGTHWHLALRMHSEDRYSDEEVIRQFNRFYGEEKEFKITRAMRFKYRTRYFSDSCIIGSKKYVLEIFQRFKSYFQSKEDRNPNIIKGLEKIYSLKKRVE